MVRSMRFGDLHSQSRTKVMIQAPQKNLKSLRALVALNVALGFMSLSMAARAESPRYNILMIISDDLTAESLGCYGNTQCQTPHIDALAKRGLQLNRAYCQFPICGPSRAALMSGTYAQCVGVTGNGTADQFSRWMGNRPSMSQYFRRKGWTASRISKIYHMRVPGDITKGVAGPDHPESWDETWNAHAPEWMTKGTATHLSREKLKMDPDGHYNLGFGGAFYVVKGEDPDGTRQADVMAADQAIRALETYNDQPFFLAVGLVRPHVPLVAPASYFDHYPRGDMKVPEVPKDDWEDIPESGISKNSQKSGLTTRAKKQDTIAAYYACVEFMDAQVGRILNRLEELKLDENTIVIFTSDHGYHLGEHDLWQKMSLHEESTRIPIIMTVPGKEAGISDSLAQQIDLYPTLAELNGLDIPDHVQGQSFAPLFDEPHRKIHDSVYCFRGRDHLIRTPDWAYIQYRDGEAELYDMRRDPKQFTNRIDHPEAEKVKAHHAQLLEEKLKQIEAAKLTPPSSP